MSVTEILVKMWSYIRYGDLTWAEDFSYLGRLNGERTVYKTLFKILVSALDVTVILFVACLIWH